jgi:hypothetical protein
LDLATAGRARARAVRPRPGAQTAPARRAVHPAKTTEPGFRIAHALEFIAAQLAQINAKVDRKP